MPEVKIFVTVDGKEYPVTFDRDPSDADIDEVANSIRAENRASQPKPTPQASNTVSSRASVSGKAPAPTTPSVAQTLFGAQTPTPQPVAPQRAVQPQQNLIQQALSQSQYAPGVAQPPKPQVNVQQPKINLASKSAGPLTSAPSFPDPAVRAAEYVNQGMYSIPPEVQTNLIQDLIFRLKHGYENLARNIMTPPQIPGKKQLSFERRPQEEVDKMGTAGKSVYAISDLINSFLPGNLQAGVLGMLAEPPKAATGLVSMASKTGMAPAVTAVAEKLGMKPEELTAKDFPDWLEATLGTGLLALGAAHGVKGLTGKMEAVAEAKKAIADNKPLPPIVEQQIQKTNIAPSEQDYFKEQMGARGYNVTGFTPEGKPIIRVKSAGELQPNPVEGETNAVSESKPATQNGNLLQQPKQVNNTVPAQEGSQGVRTNETQGTTQQSQAQEVGKKEPWQMTQKEVQSARENHTGDTFEMYGKEIAQYANRRTFGNNGGIDSVKGANGRTYLPGEWQYYHGKNIETALKEGKPVPAEVLADYPDLAAKYPQAQEVKPAIKGTPDQPVNETTWHHGTSKSFEGLPDDQALHNTLGVFYTSDRGLAHEYTKPTPFTDEQPTGRVVSSNVNAKKTLDIRFGRHDLGAINSVLDDLIAQSEDIANATEFSPAERAIKKYQKAKAQYESAKTIEEWKSAEASMYDATLDLSKATGDATDSIGNQTPLKKALLKHGYDTIRKVDDGADTLVVLDPKIAKPVTETTTPEPVRPVETPVEAPKVEPVRRRVTVNNRTFELTGEAAKRFDEIDAATKAWKEKYKDVQKGTSAWDEYQTQARARAMRDSAEKRQIVGALTAKEAKAMANKPPKTYEGVKETTGQPKEQPIPEATKPVETPIAVTKPVEAVKAKEPVKTEVAKPGGADPKVSGVSNAAMQLLEDTEGIKRPGVTYSRAMDEATAYINAEYRRLGADAVEKMFREKADTKQAVNGTEMGLAIRRARDYRRAYDEARINLDKAIKNNADKDVLERLYKEYSRASSDYEDFQKVIQTPKGVWAEVGRVLNQGINLMDGTWQEVKERLVPPGKKMSADIEAKLKAEYDGYHERLGQIEERIKELENQNATLKKQVETLKEKSPVESKKAGERAAREWKAAHKKMRQVEDIRADRAKYLDEFRESVGNASLGLNPESFKALSKYVYTFVEEGLTKIEDIVRAARADGIALDPDDVAKALEYRKLNEKVWEKEYLIEKGKVPEPKPKAPTEFSDDPIIADLEARNIISTRILNNAVRSSREPRNWIQHVGGAARNLKASTDDSFMQNQGAFYLWRHPVSAAKTFFKTIGAMKNEEALLEMMKREVVQNPRYNDAIRSGLALEFEKLIRGGEQFAPDSFLGSEIKVKGQDINPISVSERKFTAQKAIVRMEYFQTLVDMLEKPTVLDRFLPKAMRSRKATLADLKQIAEHVNTVTGEGTGNVANALKSLNRSSGAFFAPGYMVSRFKTAARSPFFNAVIQKNPAVAKLLFQEYAKTSGKIAAILYGVKAMADAQRKKGERPYLDADTDLLSKDFGKLKMGNNVTVDLSLGMFQPMRLMTKLFIGNRESPDKKPSRQGTSITAGTFATGKAAPIPRTVANILDKKAFGKSYDASTSEGKKNLAMSVLAPISVEQASDLATDWKDLDPYQRAMLGLASYLGTPTNVVKPKAPSKSFPTMRGMSTSLSKKAK